MLQGENHGTAYMTNDTKTHASKSVEDFLKAVYILQQDFERVSTNALSHALDISAPSVTDMAQRLVKDGYVDYQKYYGVRTTESGERIALKILRRHRLIELYLVRELGYSLHEVHDEAEALEHTVSDYFIESIAQKLGNPEFDPHGDPIPSIEGVMSERELLSLTKLPLNMPAKILRILSNDGELLQHVIDRGFTLNSTVTVTQRDPFEGPLTIQINDEEVMVGHRVASVILVNEPSLHSE